jgi:hypothetical protein
MQLLSHSRPYDELRKAGRTVRVEISLLHPPSRRPGYPFDASLAAVKTTATGPESLAPASLWTRRNKKWEEERGHGTEPALSHWKDEDVVVTHNPSANGSAAAGKVMSTMVPGNTFTATSCLRSTRGWRRSMEKTCACSYKLVWFTNLSVQLHISVWFPHPGGGYRRLVKVKARDWHGKVVLKYKSGSQ